MHSPFCIWKALEETMSRIGKVDIQTEERMAKKKNKKKEESLSSEGFSGNREPNFSNHSTLMKWDKHIFYLFGKWLEFYYRQRQSLSFFWSGDDTSLRSWERDRKERFTILRYLHDAIKGGWRVYKGLCIISSRETTIHKISICFSKQHKMKGQWAKDPLELLSHGYTLTAYAIF